MSSDSSNMNADFSNARILGVGETADVKILENTAQLARVEQSAVTENGTNVVFLGLAQALGFENLYHAIAGIVAVNSYIAFQGFKAWWKRLSLYSSKEEFERTKDSGVFTKNALTFRTSAEIDVEDKHEPFYSVSPSNGRKGHDQWEANAISGIFSSALLGVVGPIDADRLAKALSKKSREEFMKNAMSGALQGALASICQFNPGSAANYYRIADKFAGKSYDVLAEPFPDANVLDNSENIKKWGVAGSMLHFFHYNIDICEHAATRVNNWWLRNRFGYVADKQRAFDFEHMQDPCSEEPRMVMRTKLRDGVVQLSTDREEQKIAIRSTRASRRFDYAEAGFAMVGFAGAYEFPNELAYNASLNANNPDTYWLAALWGLIGWVALDPLKHIADSAKPLSEKIERKTDILDVQEAGLNKTEQRAELAPT